MKTRKGNGEGSVRKIKKDCYECIIQSKYYNESGNLKRIKRRGKTEDEARKKAKKALKEFEKEYKSKIKFNSANNIVEYNKKKTLKEYMNYYIDNIVKKNVAGSTYMQYVYRIEKNFIPYKIANIQVSGLDSTIIQEYYDSLLEKYEKKTVESIITILEGFLSWLYKNNIVDEYYLQTICLKKEVKDEYIRNDNVELKEIFSDDDIKKIYKAYKDNVSVYTPIYILILETMMRIGEVTAITLDDIDLKERYLYVRSSMAIRYKDNDKNKGRELYIKVTKNRHERKIYLSDLAIEAIKKMIDNLNSNCTNNPYNLLFPVYKTGNKRNNSVISRNFAKLCNELNIDRGMHITKGGKNKGLNLHALRHTAISIANSAKGANVVNTALMAGHRAISTENIYTHQTDTALKSIKTASIEVLGLENIYDDNEKQKYEEIIKSDEEAKKLLEYLKNKYE